MFVFSRNSTHPDTYVPKIIISNIIIIYNKYKYIVFCTHIDLRPVCFHWYFIIFFQVFVLLLSILVTLQQALSSGYLNSVITTIEKRYEIPSSISGIIASMYEIGNVITVIFVSYLGSRRHIPVWLGIGMFVKAKNTIIFSRTTRASRFITEKKIIIIIFFFLFRMSGDGHWVHNIFIAAFSFRAIYGSWFRWELYQCQYLSLPQAIRSNW